MREEQREVAVNRERLLIAITLLSPIVLLLVFELGLRLFGFGGSYPLFVDAEGMPGHLQANPQVIHRYFPQAPDLGIDVIYFKKQKSLRSFRIVVQGGSTAAGFPYGRWGGLAGMLGDRLEASFPDREIEVISTAMAAVNSYSLLDFVDEIIEIEPNAVLIYAGHNEYLGIMGVGSALSPAKFRRATLLRLELRKLRTYQLLQRLISVGKSFLVAAEENAGTDRGTLMALAAASAQIPFGSETYQQGVLQLEANLSLILQKYQEAGIPVYLGTLASNEKDQKPFSSKMSDRIDPDQWERAWRTYDQAKQAGDTDSARNALSQLLELDDDAADVWYAMGQLDLEAGRIGAAREACRNAKDRDQLRFRAPEAFDRLLRRSAKSYGATLVDVRQHLTDASPLGIIGDEILLDHVHPNAEGYFLLADAYYEALEQNGEIGDWSQAPSRARARQDMPITAIDRILADHAIRELEGDYPFRETKQEIRFPTPSNEIERLAQLRHRGELDWLGSMESLLQIYRRAGRTDRSVVVARMAAQAYPTLSAPNFSAGMLFMELQQFARARRYLDRSLLAEPNNTATLQALVRANLALHDEPQAKIHLARLKEIAPSHPFLRRFETQPAPMPLRSEGPRAPTPETR
jgi:lysophospholipase L1-like esterase